MFPENSYANLVFYSTIEEGKTKSQISEEWELNVSGGPLYRKDAIQQIQEMKDKGLLKENNNVLTANIESETFKSAFINYLQEKKETLDNERTRKLVGLLIEDKEKLFSWIESSQIRKNVFGIDTIKRSLKSAETAKMAPVKYYFKVMEVFVIVYTEKVVGKHYGSQVAKIVANGMIVQTEWSDTDIDVEPIVKSLKKQYNKNEYVFAPLVDAYKQLAEDALNEMNAAF